MHGERLAKLGDELSPDPRAIHQVVLSPLDQVGQNIDAEPHERVLESIRQRHGNDGSVRPQSSQHRHCIVVQHLHVHWRRPNHSSTARPTRSRGRPVQCQRSTIARSGWPGCPASWPPVSHRRDAREASTVPRGHRHDARRDALPRCRLVIVERTGGHSGHHTPVLTAVASTSKTWPAAHSKRSALL